MPAITRAPRSRPNRAPARYPARLGDQITPAAARPHRTQDPTQELSVTRGLPAEVTEHLRRHHVITLSTASFTGIPHADTVVYASDSHSIFFFAGAGTQLLLNIQDCRRASFTFSGAQLKSASHWKTIRSRTRL